MDKTKHGCKYGLKCTKFETQYDLNKYYDMKKVLGTLDLASLMYWSQTATLYKNFLQEHPVYYKYRTWRTLPREAKEHLRQYLVNRISVQNPDGKIYQDAMHFYTKMHNEQVSEKRRMYTNGSISAKTVAAGGGGGGSKGYDATYKNTAQCQGLAKSRFRGYCSHIAKSSQSANKIVYCNKCNAYMCSQTKDGLHSAYNTCRNFDYTNSGVYSPSTKSSNKDFYGWCRMMGKKISATPVSGSGGGTKGTTGSGGGTTDGGAAGAGTAGGGVVGGSGSTGVSGMPLRDTGFYAIYDYDEEGNKDRELVVRFQSSADGGEGWDAALDTIKEMVAAAGSSFTDAFGNAMGSIASQVTKNLLPGYNKKGHIMGLPMFYNPICDPYGNL